MGLNAPKSLELSTFLCEKTIHQNGPID